MLQFDNTPTVYWLLGFLFAALVAFAGYSRKIPDTLFLVGGLLLLFFMRLPAVVLNRELNPDESQMLSHAITLYQDPVYWESVDGTTIGPLDNYFLVIPKLFGVQIDYTSGRVMGLLATGVALLLLFLTIRNWSSPAMARGVWLLPLLLLAFTQEPDFVHYSSEQVPVLLISISLWFLSRVTTKERLRNYNFYILGLVLGASPFAKLQVVPIAMIVGMFAAWRGYIFLKNGRTPLSLLTLLVGALTFPLLVLVWASYHNVLQDMIDFYIKGNAIYAGGNEKSIANQFFKLVGLSPDFLAFSGSLLAGIIIALVISLKNRTTFRNAGPFNILVFSLALVAATIYSVTKSGNDFIHYLNLCIIPFTLLSLSVWKKLPDRLPSVLPILLVGWFFTSDLMHYRSEHVLNRFVSVGARTLYQSPVVLELKKYTAPGDYMVVWGWQCAYYVEAQLAQGTAENHSERSIYQHQMRQRYRNRYMGDILRTKPAVIIDAVGKNSFWVQENSTQGISSFPELSKYVREHYQYEGDFDGSKLYVRNDRL